MTGNVTYNGRTLDAKARRAVEHALGITKRGVPAFWSAVSALDGVLAKHGRTRDVADVCLRALWELGATTHDGVMREASSYPEIPVRSTVRKLRTVQGRP